MSTGTPDDIVERLKATLPSRWFADDTPVLDALLRGLASAWSTIHCQLQAARSQARLASASGGFLDLIASDFFANRIRRKPGQGDAAWREAIRRELIRERATRAGIIGALQDLTGNTPTIFEPACPADTGGWATLGGYNAAGAWGSLAMPYQCLITIKRPTGGGIPGLPGWNATQAGYNTAAAWASLAMLQGQTTDTDIYTTTAAVMPTNAIAWVRITS